MQSTELKLQTKILSYPLPTLWLYTDVFLCEDENTFFTV